MSFLYCLKSVSQVTAMMIPNVHGPALHLIVIFLLFSVEISSKDFNLDAISFRTVKNHRVLPFANTTSGKAVVVEAGVPLSVIFCLRKASVVVVKNIRYLNVNISSKMKVRINNLDYGTYISPPNYNHTKFFANSGPLSKNRQLEGWNTLKLYINSTVAIDIVTISVDDDKLNRLIFNCEVTCIKDASFPVENPTDVAAGYMAQNSFPTKCAEVDNVDVPIYHPSVSKFSVTATLPQYKSFVNRRQENLTNCPHLSETLWIFPQFTLSSSTPELSHNRSWMAFHQKAVDLLQATVTFTLEGSSSGSIDSDMGSLLVLKFFELPSAVSVTPRVKQRNGTMSQFKKVQFDSKILNYTWNVPDYTWVEKVYNYIELDISSPTQINFHVEYLKLDRRPFVPDKTVTLYKSDDTIIEGILVDMWWRGRERMDITIHNVRTYEGYAFLRIYSPVPWDIGASQVFILYQDGNARFLPISPTGLDWIPFGTSVIIGQINHDSSRPYASISHVTIFPEEMRLHVKLLDGGSFNMDLEVREYFTRGVIHDIHFTRNRYVFPFVAARSMYVEEGNTDVDSVKVDDTTTYNIMDNWGVVQGHSFAFHRRCMSKHLDLSPDIEIRIINVSNRPAISNLILLITSAIIVYRCSQIQ